MNQEEILHRIRTLLSRFQEEVNIDNTNGEFSINIHAENVLLSILNIAYDLDLINVNYEEGKTFPAIDLKDERKKTAFQISSSGTVDKVVYTLQEYVGKGMDKKYDYLYFYFLKGMDKRVKNDNPRIIRAMCGFNKDNLVFLDHGQFYLYLNKINDMDKLVKIRSLLEAQFSDAFLRKSDIDAFALLTKSNSHERSIDNSDKQYISSNIIFGNLSYKSDYWVTIFRRYQSTLNIYKYLFDKGEFISDILPNIEKGEDNILLNEYVLNAINNKEVKHIYVNGTGGAGKTVSLIYLNKILLDKGIPSLYIPLNRIRNHDNNGMPLKEWIMSNVLIYDTEFQSVSLAEKYEKLMVMNSTSNASFVLILDGVNEVIDNSFLANELVLWNTFQNVSIIVSSRNNEFYNISDNENYEYIRILPLSNQVVLDYLRGKDIDKGITPLVSGILNIPQMLSLYVGTSLIQKKYNNVRGLDWRKAGGISDIIHNFFVCQIAENVFEKHLCSLYEAILTTQYILPSLAWNFYLNKTNSIELREVLDVIKFELSDVIEREKKQKELPIILEISRNVGEKINTSDIVSLILDHLTLLDEYDPGQYIFVHQNYFEYLVSVYWKNMAERSIGYGINTCWRTDIIPTFTGQFFSDTDGKYIKSDIKILYQYFDQLRNYIITKDDNSLFNIIRFLDKKNNWRLSEIDFSNLDLRNLSLNGAVLSDNEKAAKFCGAHISNNTFSPKGHHAAILQVFFFPQEQDVLYTRDLHGVLGVYDLQTDKKLKTIKNYFLSGSENIVLSASSPEQFMVPEYNTFLEKTLVSMIKIYPDETGLERIHPGRLNPFRDKLLGYIASVDKWIIKIKNRIYVAQNIDDINETNYVWELSDNERFYRIIDNLSQTTVLLQLLCKKNEEIEEKIIKIDHVSNENIEIYNGSIIVGNSQVFLSDDGTVMAITNGNASVRIIRLDNFTISQVLTLNIKVETKIKGFISLSPDKQWCVWIGPIATDIYSFKVYIWNLWKKDLLLTYEYNDIISSHCFSPDSKHLILGIFNGSIDSINLESYMSHHIAIGYRVDQKLFNIDGKLVVRRSDNYYQVWDVGNKRVCGKHIMYSFPMQKTYNVTSSGKYWYSSIDKGAFGNFKIWDVSKQKHQYIDLFTKGDKLLSNAVEDTIIEINYHDNNLTEILYYLYDFNSKPIVNDIERIALPEFANKYGYIKKIHFTCQKRYLVIILSISEGKDFIEHVPQDMGKPWVLVWDIDNNCKKSLFKFEDRTLYMDQQYEICSYEERIMICIHHPISFYIIDTQKDDYMKYYETAYMPIDLLTTRPENEISCISIKQKEEVTPPPRGFLIAPDGTIITDRNHDGNTNIFESDKKIVPVGAKQISVGDAMCSIFITKNTVAIGCTSGIILFVRYSDDETKCIALNESDDRVADLIVMNDDKHNYLLAAQKDDNIYIWDIDTISYEGYLRSIPGSDIYNCDFRNAVFESKDVEYLVNMNGGIINS